jgi:hypothetical protein
MIFTGYLVSILTRKRERRSAGGVLTRKHFAERRSGNREGNSSWVFLCMSVIGDIWGSEPLVSSVTVVKYCYPGRARLTHIFFKTRTFLFEYRL